MDQEYDFETLQNLVKRQPEGYTDEIQTQNSRLDAMIDIILLTAKATPNQQIKLPQSFARLISFLSNISASIESCSYNLSERLSQIIHKPNILMRLSLENSTAVVKAVILSHNRCAIPSATAVPALFNLITLPDKQLRNLIYFHLIKNLCANSTRRKKRKIANSNPPKNLKTDVIKFLAEKTRNDDVFVVKKALGILSELYRRDFSRDAKTVNIIAESLFSPKGSVVRKTAWFLLGEDFNREDEDLNTEANLNVQLGVCKGVRGVKISSKRERKMERIKKKIKKSEEKTIKIPDFGPIRSLFDPYEFAERLFRNLKKCRENFETKMLLMRLLARIISTHELQLVNFYSFMMRYMQPHQRNVTKILSYLVQATHSSVPVMALQPCIRQLSLNFITDRCNPEVIAVGLNTIREISARNKSVMDEDLLRDLSMYKTSNEKCVSVAARGLIGLFRIINPSLLAKPDRGKPDKAACEEGKEGSEMESEESEEEIDRITPEFPVESNDILGHELLRKDRQKELVENKKEKYRGKKKGGTTNEDKKRKKLFQITKHSRNVNDRKKRSRAIKNKIDGEHTKRMKLKSRRKFKRKFRG